MGKTGILLDVFLLLPLRDDLFSDSSKLISPTCANMGLQDIQHKPAVGRLLKSDFVFKVILSIIPDQLVHLT